MADKKKLSIKYFPASKLTTFPGNPRKVKDPDAVKKLTKLIELHGFQNPLQIWQSEGINYILCGNHRFKAACDLGYTEFPCIIYDGTKEEALARVISDNKSSEYTEWDYPLLKDFITDIDLGHLDIEITGFGEDELEALFGYEGLTEEEQAEKDAIEDEVPDVPAEPVTRPGDLYLLGRHRLLCGDSTNITDVERLMDGKKADMVFTDPPYGIEIVQGNSVGGGGPTKFGKVGGGNIVAARTYKKIEGDNSTEAARDFYNLCVSLKYPLIILWGGNYFTDFLPPSMCWIVWDKENTGNFADCELAWVNHKRAAKLYKHLWNGLCRKGDHQTEGRSRVHPTQKPVGLFIDIFKDFEGDVVLDGFLGSGSTLIACEKTGRTCYGMELDAHYCDVIVARWEKFTGKKAKLCQPS